MELGNSSNFSSDQSYNGTLQQFQPVRLMSHIMELGNSSNDESYNGTRQQFQSIHLISNIMELYYSFLHVWSSNNYSAQVLSFGLA
jgi:hypothetical protein